MSSEEQASAYILTGMPNAGKTTAANMLSNAAFEVYEEGDAVRELENDSTYSVSERGSFVEELKSEKGPDVFARELVNIFGIKSDPGTIPVISGVRQEEEREFFEEYFGDVETVAVIAGKDTRRQRYSNRGRKEDKEGQKFDDRDNREIEQGIGEIIANSDRYVKNEGSFIDLTYELTETLDFNPNLYEVNIVDGSDGQSSYEVNFEYPAHAERFADITNPTSLNGTSMIFTNRDNSEDEIETDIQNFYTEMMIEAVK